MKLVVVRVLDKEGIKEIVASLPHIPDTIFYITDKNLDISTYSTEELRSLHDTIHAVEESF